MFEDDARPAGAGAQAGAGKAPEPCIFGRRALFAGAAALAGAALFGGTLAATSAAKGTAHGQVSARAAAFPPAAAEHAAAPISAPGLGAAPNRAAAAIETAAWAPSNATGDSPDDVSRTVPATGPEPAAPGETETAPETEGAVETGFDPGCAGETMPEGSVEEPDSEGQPCDDGAEDHAAETPPEDIEGADEAFLEEQAAYAAAAAAEAEASATAEIAVAGGDLGTGEGNAFAVWDFEGLEPGAPYALSAALGAPVWREAEEGVGEGGRAAPEIVDGKPCFLAGFEDEARAACVIAPAAPDGSASAPVELKGPASGYVVATAAVQAVGVY